MLTAFIQERHNYIYAVRSCHAGTDHTLHILEMVIW